MTVRTVRTDYLDIAQNLIGSCRMAAVHSLPPEARDRADRMFQGRLRRTAENMGDAYGDRLLDRGAELAAHLVFVRMHAVGINEGDDGGCADALLAAIPALDSDNTTERLGAAREVAALADLGGWASLALRDLATLLAANRSAIPNAAGHLCRRVLADFPGLYQPFADLGYWSCYGDRYLTPPAITRAAAIGLVVTGRQKSDISRRAGISRQTLDNWLRAEAER